MGYCTFGYDISTILVGTVVSFTVDTSISKSSVKCFHESANTNMFKNRSRFQSFFDSTCQLIPLSNDSCRELANKLSNESENMQDSDNVSMLTSMNTGNTAGSVFPFSKQNTDLFEVSSSRPEFGLVPSDSLTSSPHSSLKKASEKGSPPAPSPLLPPRALQRRLDPRGRRLLQPHCPFHC